MEIEVLILLVAFIAMLALNVPIAFAIGISTFLAIFTLSDVPTTYRCIISC